MKPIAIRETRFHDVTSPHIYAAREGKSHFWILVEVGEDRAVVHFKDRDEFSRFVKLADQLLKETEEPE